MKKILTKLIRFFQRKVGKKIKSDTDLSDISLITPATSDGELAIEYYYKSDYLNAFQAAERAAKQEDAAGFMYLALMYLFGRGVSRNYSLASENF